MSDVTATEAARRFADLLYGLEHRGEHYMIVRRGGAIAATGSDDRPSPWIAVRLPVCLN